MKPNIYLTKHFRYIAIVVCILLNGFSNHAKAQLVLVPDSNFRAALVAKGFGGCFVGNYIDSTCSLVSGCTYLNIENKGIHDLTGIEAFQKLDSLFCGRNQLANLPTLPNSLTTLYCYFNQLVNLPYLPTSLTYFLSSTLGHPNLKSK